jgi:hypothetical protein
MTCNKGPQQPRCPECGVPLNGWDKHAEGCLKGPQQPRCPECGVPLNGWDKHAEGCLYLARLVRSPEEIVAQRSIAPSDLSVWEAMQHRLEALHADFFGAQTTNATPSEPRPLTLADLERAVHDIDPDGRFLQDARLMVACHKLNKEQVETVIGFAERLGL